jgi:type 1 glutamine amidotransferase
VKQALVVRHGWEGHVPVSASDRYARGYSTVADVQLGDQDHAQPRRQLPAHVGGRSRLSPDGLPSTSSMS